MKIRCLVLFCSVSALAQPRDVERATIQMGTNRVSITISGGERVVQANGWPDHTPGKFPNRRNPNTISAQSYNFHLPLNPQVTSEPRRANGAWFGVALNGVPFE